VDLTRFHYSAFGDGLCSTMPLPELRPIAPGPVRWTFETVDRLPEPEALERMGEEPIYGSVSAKLLRHASGYRIVIDDTGVYDLLDHGGSIRWRPNQDPWWDFGRSHLIGRVLATSLQLSGVVTLHGSAVEMGSGVVAFLAPKRFGKSTLAAALLRAGARFVTDDSLAIDERLRALPGIPSLRVHAADAGAWSDLAPSAAVAPQRDGKIVLPPLPEDRMLARPTPLAGVYFLLPRRSGLAVPAVERAEVPAVVGAMRLMGQTKIGAMLGAAFAPALLDRAAAVAGSVPTFELGLIRDVAQLPEAVDRLLAWHGLPQPAAQPAAR
jgi:hypothetical protein